MPRSTNFSRGNTESVFRISISQILLPSIRGYSWHKNLIRRGYYRGNNFQDSTKTKIAEIKTLGYLPRVLFFNVFELDAEKEHASSIFECRSVKINVRSLLNKNLYFINTSFRIPSRNFFKQKTAYEILRSDWSSDVCSFDLLKKSTLGR